MKTFKKAKEIFNSQINKAVNEDNFSLKEVRSSSLKKIHSTTRLYKLYLYNKTLQFGLKKLNLFKASKNKKTFYKVLFQINKLSIPLEKTLRILLRTILVKFYILAKTRKGSLTKFSYGQKLKNLIRYINLRLFSNFFEYKIFYWLKTRKNFASFKAEIPLFFKYLKNSKKFVNEKIRLKDFILKLKTWFKKVFINLHWSNQTITSVLKRIQLVFCVYLLAFLLISFNAFSCLPQSGQLLIKFANALNINVNSLQNFIQYFRNSSLIYFAFVFKRTNALVLPKNVIGHLGVCTSLSLISICLDFSTPLINNLVKSSVLLTDIYFCRFFIQTDKKLKFLRHFNIVTGENDLRMYHFQKLFKRTIILKIDEIQNNRYISPVNRIIGSSNYYYKIGKYESFTQKLLNIMSTEEGSGTFIRSHLFFPFYLILLTSLVYNCCYYIIYNKRPYIPIVSSLADKITPKTPND